jgi:CheY-like chemotaxis protein
MEGAILTPDIQSSSSNAGKTKILLVEDNKIDARLTRQALQQIPDWPSIIDVVNDGEEALKFLLREQAYADALTPDLVILDLNLPRCDGTQLLQFIRASQQLHNLLVFIFSSSPVDVAEDRMHSAQVKADSYFEKPNQLDKYFSIAAQIKETYRRAAGERKAATA